MLNFPEDPRTYSALNNKLDAPLYNTFFNNTPWDPKFAIGSFNYNPVTQTSFSFFQPKKPGANKRKSNFTTSFLSQNKAKGNWSEFYANSWTCFCI